MTNVNKIRVVVLGSSRVGKSVHMSSESESEDPFAGYDSDKDKEYFPSESDRRELNSFKLRKFVKL
ncbi:unnamed protein product [Acanthoscelides obtectus]|uniref:Uncharacterized protein n=1 Tax=Acanthoscelides obtectus TaxID=200917 RepID=A0A9P0LQL3_ACAOB|nr:unnamed protein product [Acanthoscelides obtectus]CAK1679199.1 hypothetical protein AOBTE_LOCUS32167 [Acanthoscelides obtectus]